MKVARTSSTMTNTQCGLEFLSFYPRWLQKFANPKFYVILYALLGMLWHTITSYFTGTLTTVQKNFQMSSNDLALISTVAEFGGMISNLILPYYVSKKHPIRTVSCGMYMIGAACFIKVLPHHFSEMGSEMKKYTQEYDDKPLHFTAEREGLITNISFTDPESAYCQESDTFIFYLFVLSHFFVGVGNTLYWTSGIVYMDQNCSKRAFPLLFSVFYAIRYFGQAIGYFLSSVTLRIFLYPSLTPVISIHDPKWIGAWWIGWYVLGTAYFVIGFLHSLFPRRLPTTTGAVDPDAGKTVERVISICDYFTSLKRIMSNKVIFFDALSSVFYSIGLSAYGTFFPKYIESLFQFSPAKSVLILGYIGIVSKVTGLLFNGIVVSMMQPSSRFLIGFNIVAEIVSLLGHLSYVLFGCSSARVEGHWNSDHSWNITEDCNSDCGPHIKYSPVCDLTTKKQYYSACHAGCTILSKENETKTYYNCSCLPDSGSVVEGFCPTDCASNVIVFVLILTFMKFLRGAIRIIKPLIKLRSVDKDDKTMTIGISQAILQIMGLMPAPLIYGMIMDYTCIMWDRDCNGSPGQCWFNDQDRLRSTMNYTATSFLAVGIVLDCFVWYNVKTVRMFDDVTDSEKQRSERQGEDDDAKDVVNRTAEVTKL